MAWRFLSASILVLALFAQLLLSVPPATSAPLSAKPTAHAARATHVPKKPRAKPTPGSDAPPSDNSSDAPPLDNSSEDPTQGSTGDEPTPVLEATTAPRHGRARAKAEDSSAPEAADTVAAEETPLPADAAAAVV